MRVVRKSTASVLISVSASTYDVPIFASSNRMKMKRKIFTYLMLLLCSVCAAQDFGMMNRYRTAKVRMIVVDASTGAPVEFATVYLCPQGDTTITNFALTGEDGIAVIEDVTQGKYQLNAELVGYKHFKKDVDISLSEFEREKNLGRIQMEQSREFLDAASVTAAGNPVVMKKDTVVFNASAYRTVENAMLADLLKKMPGFKIGADGSVKVNGEAVNRITVDGKTFFQKDPGLAVKSLPARIVDRIQVIDRSKDDAEFTGVGTKDDQEKVMDIMLKDEYQNGWFGNLKTSGGATVNMNDEVYGKDKALFNSNAMVSYYSPEDQMVFLGSAKNAAEPGSWSEMDDFAFGMPGSEMDALATKQGLQTTGQAGINYNTTRLKGLETTTSLSYNFLQKDVREESSRTSFQGDLPSILTDGKFDGLGTDHTLSFSAELKNSDKSRYMFAFRPYFMYVDQNRSISQSSTTKTGETLDNTSTSASLSHSRNLSTFIELEAGIKDMGKKRRSLTLAGDFFIDRTGGTSSERSRTVYRDTEDIRDLNYGNRSFSIGPQMELSYVEPFGDNWSLQTRISGSYNGSRMQKDAFNGIDGSANDYFSSYSRNDDFIIRQRLLAQYKKGDASILFGFQMNQEQNVTKARYIGKESIVGQGEWILNWAPYVDFVMKKDVSTLRFEYKGRSSTPSGKRIIPTLDISNPVQIGVGNIYLRPSFTHNAMLDFSTGNTERYSFLEMFLWGSMSTSPIVSASWFDAEGVRYAIPVNSTRPGGDISAYASYNKTFGKNRNFTFTLDGDISFSSNTGYQTTKRLPAIDKDAFDYEGLMQWFWGNSAGDRFYSGESGFAESRTNTLSTSLYPSIAYRHDWFSITLMGYAVNSITKYSLDKTANMNTWDFNATGEFLLTTPKNWQFSTDLGYNFYQGYSAGYGEPELIWNAGIAKDIKAFTLSLKCADILGQQKSLHRTTSAEFVEDVRRNVMGRYFLVGLVFNFGRMNASQSSKVERAMWEMTY